MVSLKTKQNQRHTYKTKQRADCESNFYPFILFIFGGFVTSSFPDFEFRFFFRSQIRDTSYNTKQKRSIVLYNTREHVIEVVPRPKIKCQIAHEIQTRL